MPTILVSNQRKDFERIASKIKSLVINLSNSETSYKQLKMKNTIFLELFTEHKGLHIVGAIICIAALIFDFFVSNQSLLALSSFIHINVVYLALLFTVFDGCVAVFHSGGLHQDPMRKERAQKLWLWVLIILALIKIILFILLVYSAYQVINAQGQLTMQLETWDLLKIIIPQVFFIALIYFVFGIAGFSLYYFTGNIWYKLWKFLLPNQDDLKKQFDKQCVAFRERAGYYGIELNLVAQEFEIYQHIFRSQIK